MKQFFSHCKTLEALKQEYKTLAKQYHPDMPNGDEAIMQHINAQYDETIKFIANNPFHADFKQAATEDINAYKDIISSIITLKEIVIELCGSWLWVTGNTYLVKDVLKNAGFKFAGKKKAWYWRAEDEAFTRSRKEYSMDDIRLRHGTQRINGYSPLILA